MGMDFAQKRKGEPMRVIDADALIERLKKEAENTDPLSKMAIARFIAGVKSFPTVEPEWKKESEDDESRSD